jgi:sensor c-di-GMP phosphodiesterase-like protein
MAHSLRLSVVAVGIETREQLAYLLQQGCETGQGHLFSAAQPVEQAFGLPQNPGVFPG